MNGIIQECRESPLLAAVATGCVAATVSWCVLLAKVLL